MFFVDIRSGKNGTTVVARVTGAERYRSERSDHHKKKLRRSVENIFPVCSSCVVPSQQRPDQWCILWFNRLDVDVLVFAAFRLRRPSS